MELNFQKSKGPWPLKATADSVELEFSGSFSLSRVRDENLNRALDKFSKFTLWLLAVLGLVGLALSLEQGWQEKNWLFFLKPSLFNLDFWLAAFTTCYFWAKTQQQKLEEQSLNLIHWESLQQAPSPALDIYQLFNREAKQAWNRAIAACQGKQAKNDSAKVSAIDLLLSLLNDQSVKMVFFRLGVNIEDIKILLKNYTALSAPQQEKELYQLPFIAFSESLKLHNKAIDPLMLLCALAQTLPADHIIQAIFFNIDLDLEKLEIIASWIFNLELLRQDLQLFKKLAKFKPEGEIDKGLASVPTPFLDRFSTDLTWSAKHGYLPLALGRAADLQELFKTLSEEKNSIIIKGAEGSGRSTLINELAYKMVTEQVPLSLRDKRLIRLELAALFSRQQRTESDFISLLNEATQAGNIVLIIEDLHALNKMVSASGISLLEMLISFLQDHGLLVIGTTTVNDYNDYLRDTANFDSTFSSYELIDLTRESIFLACCIKASLLEAKEKCFFRYQAIQQAVNDTDLYVKGVSQPQKAISVLVEAATKAKSNKIKVVTDDLVQKIISQKTHIPMQALNQSEKEKLLNLESLLGKYIVGQQAAISAVAEGLRRSRSGLASTARPLGSFLFLGPTGVGKTEVAKTLASVYFGEEKFMLSLDMSEYRGTEGLAKLLGQPGSKADTVLVKHLKNYPFCLLLIDELEKASPEILNIFLQVLEEGRLTTAKGETIDLTHCLIIATSNAGAKDIQDGIKTNLTVDQIKVKLFNGVLTETFPPELLNRFDGIILFSPLTQQEIERIAFLQLGYLKSKLNEKGIKLEFTDNVIRDISTNAFDPQLGARPIRRYIQDHVEGFIAKLLLSQDLPRGSEITVDFQDGQLVVL